MAMRNLLFSGALGLALCAAGAASAAPNVAGVWRVSGRIVYGKAFFQATPTCVFSQRGSQIAGSCTGPHATGPVMGVVSGKSISWTWSNHGTDAVGITGMSRFDGSFINSRLIRGTMTSTATPGVG